MIAFDLDDTLVKPIKGKFSSATNLQLAFPEDIMRAKLPKEFIVITNQLGVSKGKTTELDIVAKINLIEETFGVKVNALIAYNDDIFRKPRTGWMRSEIIMYVGDAAGRKGDHADTDLKFAINANIQFQTPEMFFLDKPIDYVTPVLNLPVFKPGIEKIAAQLNEMKNTRVMLVGAPGSGKTTFRNLLTNYQVVNNDEKRKAIPKSGNVVFDNTNPVIKEQCDVVVYFDIPRHHCEYMSKFRQLTTGKNVPTIAFNIYYSKLQVPENAIVIDHYSTPPDHPLFGTWLN